MNTLMQFLAAILSILLANMPAMASAHEWKTYTNVRFGYHICYPADLLTAGPEADNGDGRVFSARSGAELRVWGNYNALEQDMDAIVRDLADPDATITYRRGTKSWAVVSGHKNGDIFYAKVLMTRNAKDGIDSVHTFRLTYPAGETKTYDAVAERLAKCFRLAE